MGQAHRWAAAGLAASRARARASTSQERMMAEVGVRTNARMLRSRLCGAGQVCGEIACRRPHARPPTGDLMPTPAPASHISSGWARPRCCPTLQQSQRASQSHKPQSLLQRCAICRMQAAPRLAGMTRRAPPASPLQAGVPLQLCAPQRSARGRQAPRCPVAAHGRGLPHSRLASRCASRRMTATEVGGTAPISVITTLRGCSGAGLSRGAGG